MNIDGRIPDGSVDMVFTSPPYWGLRDYGTEPQVWDGDENCEHEWGNSIKPKGKSNWNTFEKYRGDGGKGKRNIGMDNISQGSFCSKCNAWKGSLGLEPTFNLYIKHLCDIFDIVHRKLKPYGSCWVNLGDTYWGGGQGGSTCGSKEILSTEGFGHVAKGNNYPDKSLCCIPDHFKIEMINRGWILRNTIIWHKRNCMPSSASDRFTVDFEYLFFFVKSNNPVYWTHRDGKITGNKPKPDYRWVDMVNNIEYKEKPPQYNKRAVECPDCRGIGVLHTSFGCGTCGGGGKIRQWNRVNLWQSHDYYFEQQFDEYTLPLDRWGGCYTNGNVPNSKYLKSDIDSAQLTKRARNFRPNEQGRNKRCVWTINTQPYKDAHFAVFPKELVETPLKAGCPEFVCRKCGLPREKIYKQDTSFHSGSGKSGNEPKGKYEGKEQSVSGDYDIRMGPKIDRELIGYTDCGCKAGFKPGVIWDPFVGSGTVMEVAQENNRDSIGCDLNKKYLPYTLKRLNPYINQKSVYNKPLADLEIIEI